MIGGEAIMTYILIVDDEACVRDILALMIESFRCCRVLKAKSGHEALNLVHENGQPGFAFIDEKMPGMPGNELCEKLMRDFGFSPARIAIISGYNRDQIECREDVHFLRKPFDLNSLRELLCHFTCECELALAP